MGNCFETSKKSTAEIVPQEFIRGGAGSATSTANSAAPAVRLYGSPNNPLTSYIRFALLFKSVKFNFVSSDALSLQIGSDSVSGSRGTVLRFLETRFPNPPLSRRCHSDGEDDETEPQLVNVTALQHKSVVWHVERLLRWAKDLSTRGGRRTVDPAMGTPRMELRKFGRSYNQLLEVMLEHAQMEEKVIFPILEMADRGLCKAANEEHARDLPIMNGIKEDIKSTGVLDSGSTVCQEALSNISKRLKLLLEHCKHHFIEEEKNLLPLLEAVELSKEQQERMMEQLLEVMKQTHSHLLNFFLEGLLPQEAMQYLDLISRRDTGKKLCSLFALNDC